MRNFHRLVQSACLLLPILGFADADSSKVGEFDSSEESRALPPKDTLFPIQNNETRVVPSAAQILEKPLEPFTGKIRGNRVRMRTKADLESPVVRELERGTLLVVVGEKGDFFAVEAPSGSGYVFRTFVLDEKRVEGNHVNIRRTPDTEAEILGQLNSGDQIEGKICEKNPKWLEIALPTSVHFYVAKDFVEKIGGPFEKVKIEQRKTSVTEKLETAIALTKVELRKPFRDMDVEKIQHLYTEVISDFPDFPEKVAQAKEELASLQKVYVDKKIAFLEAQLASTSSTPQFLREELLTHAFLPTIDEEPPTQNMRLWEASEEAVYLKWAALQGNRNSSPHSTLTMQDFYEDQRISSLFLTGSVEPYSAPGVKNKPGSHLLKDLDGRPLAYLYSTKVNLENYSTNKVTTFRVVERPNNHFAFPAYFVLAQE
jgi:hypothetical protein